MKRRTTLIIGWIAALPVIAMHAFAAVTKFMTFPPDSLQTQLPRTLGYADIIRPLGLLEMAIVILFILPRTSTVGFILMVGYTAGILATHFTHGFTAAQNAPIFVMLLLLAVSAWFRNPELTARLRGEPVPGER